MKFLKEKNFLRIFFFVHLVAAARVFSEIVLFNYEFKTSLYQNLLFYLENDYYFLIGVFTVPLLVSLFAKTRYTEALSTAARYFPLVILTPWIDHFLTGRVAGYENAEATPGILVQVVLIIGGVILFTYKRSRELPAALAAGIGAYLWLWFVAMPEFIFPPQANFASDMFMHFYYFIPFFLESLVFFCWNDRASFHALKKIFRRRPALESVLLTLAGILTLYFMGYRIHEIHVLHIAALIFLLRGVPDDGLPQNAAAVLSFVALSYAFTLGLPVFWISGAALILILIRKNFGRTGKILAGSLVLGLCYFIAFYGAPYVTPLFNLMF